MKKLVLVLLLMCPTALLGQATEDFPLTVYVVSSKWVPKPLSVGGASAFTVMQISVVISGKKFELDSNAYLRDGLLIPGDYKARLIKSKDKTPTYELNQTYLLQFPDGKTTKFFLEETGK